MLVLDGITMTTMHNVVKTARVVVRAVIEERLLQSRNSRKLESDLEQVKGKNSSIQNTVTPTSESRRRCHCATPASLQVT
ncbi:hypothetical protein TIFTF001_011431 [Ficus carica]|uniref:Uncharacterized protein n=1 Tax=Ficus carica TaxID=3494 RepID=A0AA88AAG3_FICCA|nr:hypothetical protein TIFTF001_011431 [Ficus carica]